MNAITYGLMEFAKKLRYHIKQERLSQDRVAKELDISQSMVSAWCRGAYKPDVAQVKLLSEVLRISLDYLLDDSIPAFTLDEVETDREIRRLIRDLGFEEARSRLIKKPSAPAPPRFVEEDDEPEPRPVMPRSAPKKNRKAKG